MLIGIHNIHEIIKEDGCLTCLPCYTAAAEETVTTNPIEGDFSRLSQTDDVVNSPLQDDNALEFSSLPDLCSATAQDGTFQDIDVDSSHGIQSCEKDDPDNDAEITVILSENQNTINSLELSKEGDMTVEGDPENDQEGSNMLANVVKSILQYWLDPLVLEVLTYALVCSSDNIGIYIALFSDMKPMEVAFIIAIFYILLAFNIIVAALLMQVCDTKLRTLPSV